MGSGCVKEGGGGIGNTDLGVTQLVQKCCEILRLFISFTLAVNTKAEKLAWCLFYPWTQRFMGLNNVCFNLSATGGMYGHMAVRVIAYMLSGKTPAIQHTLEMWLIGKVCIAPWC